MNKKIILILIVIVVAMLSTACKPKYKIEVNNKLPGELYLGETKIIDLKKESKHVIKVDSLGAYIVRMVYHEEVPSDETKGENTENPESESGGDAEAEAVEEEIEIEPFIETKLIVVTKKGKTKANFHQVLRFGSIGPAGGLIFYYRETEKKGVWQYLEAAPVETEVITSWGLDSLNVIWTESQIDTGKRNTILIVDQLEDRDLMYFAADMCYYLDSIEGHYGWFLPSKDELEMMYRNLKLRGLGDFEDTWYWSSTQHGQFTAWAQNFANGYAEGNFLKTSTFRVRAIRGI